MPEFIGPLRGYYDLFESIMAAVTDNDSSSKLLSGLHTAFYPRHGRMSEFLQNIVIRTAKLFDPSNDLWSSSTSKRPLIYDVVYATFFYLENFNEDGIKSFLESVVPDYELYDAVR